MTTNGLGSSTIAVSSLSLIDIRRGFFIAEVCRTLAITLMKTSILGFYWRFVATSKRARYIVFTSLGDVILWAIVAVRLGLESL